MRPTPPTTTAGLRPSLRRGGVLLAMLVLLVAVLAPTALAEPPADAPPADPPPEHAAEPAQDTGNGDPDAKTGDPDDNAADDAQPGERDDNAADDAQPGERDDDAADDADGGNESENAAGGEGNRGHVQLSADGETLPPNNEPHLPCEFVVMFYDMREGTEQATVEFFAQPPSGGPGELLLGDTVALDGEAGEGVTFNGSEEYDLEPYVGDLTYHEQQGYHIKLTVSTTPEDVSADQKHHVFWIDCAPAEEDDQPAPADLTVTKDVTGDDAPAADTEFEVTVVCDEVTEVVDLTDGQTWSWNDDGTQEDLTEDSTCTVDETVTHGAEVTVTFDGTDVDEGATLDLDPGTNTVTVTNDFPATGVDDTEETQDGDEGEQTPEGEQDEQPPAGEEDEQPSVGVLPDEVERPAPTPAAPFAPIPAPDVEPADQQPVVAVQDAAAERLPRTGVSSTTLLVLALTLLGSGVVALRRTRPVTAR